MALVRIMTIPRHAVSPTTVLNRGLPERRYLPELHGIRGLALLGVVLFHLFGNGRTSGGIDIFLAVSGFLFTGMLLREAANSGGRIDPFRYLGRLVRRILVPAAIVVAATLLTGLAISPVTQHSQLWAEARASLLYFENFELINSQLAYGAAGPETSPFQHFWSLSVQGQFYLIWPLIAIAAVLIAKRLKTSAAKIMGVLIGIIFIMSLVYAIYVGSYNQDEAYLMTTTRAWQLAFGGFLALAGGSIRLPKPLRMPAGWIGVAMIALCGVVLDGAALFPGPWALWPLAGLTLVLIAAGPQGGDKDPVGSATHFLSNRVLAWIGNHAYGLYLWHWPLLIFYLEFRDREAIGIRGALVILAITTLLAMLMYRFVESPLKNRQTQRSPQASKRINKIVVVTTAAGLVLTGTGATVVLNKPANQVANVFEDWDWQTYPGAMVTTDQYNEPPEVEEYLPAVEDLGSNRPSLYEDGCVQTTGNGPGRDEVTVCEDPNKPDNPTATVVISGGSHSVHWYEAWRALAEEYGWELLVVNKNACVLMDTTDPESADCNAWNNNYIEWLQDHDVDLVVANGTRIFRSSFETIHDGAQTRWQQITDTGAELVLMRGTPRPNDDVADCLASGNTPQDCGADTHQIADANPLQEQNLPEGTHHIDMVEHVCPEGMSTDSDQCPAVVGNVVVWYDNSHLADQYVATMTPILEAKLREEMSWLFN